jgi:hypothetical protein
MPRCRALDVTLGYLKQENATKQTYTSDGAERWLHTGDEVEVRLSEKGYEHYWIVGRIKELIKVLPSRLHFLIVGAGVSVKKWYCNNMIGPAAEKGKAGGCVSAKKILC